MEVERKFLVTDHPPLEDSDSRPIEQGYLAAGDSGEVRLRRDGERLLLTVKQGSGLSREEEEVGVSPEQFDALWPLTDGRRLSKRRHVLPHGELRIEVDVYEGELSGLVVAEVEFADEAEARAFDPPGWLGEEVTGDVRYANESLAEKGAASPLTAEAEGT